MLILRPKTVTYLTAGEGGVYFVNGVGILFSGLYRTDGTAAGTHQLTLPAITGTLGFIYAMQSTADGLYVRITETFASEPILCWCKAIRFRRCAPVCKWLMGAQLRGSRRLLVGC